jgi:four helix bundle protein
MKIEKFEDLHIWQEARELNVLIYKVTGFDPFNRDFKLKDQIRNASGSIMDNIAEGFGRGGNKEFNNFLSIANGSNNEVRSQLYRAFDCQYIDKDQLHELLKRTESIAQKIRNLSDHLKNSQFRGAKFK